MKKPIIKRTCFTIRRPIGARRTFAVLKDTYFLDGPRTQVTLDDSRVHAVNTNMQRGLLTVDEAYAHLKLSVIPALKAEAKISEKKHNSELLTAVNRKVLDQFYQARYKHSELLKRSKRSAYNLIAHALRDIDPLPITTATLSQLRSKLEKIPTVTQRRHTLGLNQLLKFLGRDIRLSKRRRESQVVDYVTWDELQEILPHIPQPEIKALVVTLFGTGVRIGEAFAPGFTTLRPKDTIFISKQLDLEGEIRDIKNGKPHMTILLPEAKAAYLAWCRVPNKAELRQSAINAIIAASKRAFPKRPEKQVSAHDLRHSFAIHLAGQGASVRQLSALLGDTQSTVELHYIGFIMNDDAIDNVRKLIDKGKK